ncbi:MAG: ABC transporter permease [Gemmatimonas sp.]
MDKLFAVIRREYLERVRSRWFLIATLFGPVFFGLLMFLPALIASREKASGDASKIIIIDATGVSLGDRVAIQLGGGLTGTGGQSKVRAVSSDSLAPAESLATKSVIREEFKGYLVLDSSTVAGHRARYSGSNTTAIFDMQKLDRAIQHEVLGMRLEKSGIDPELGRELSSLNVNFTTERLTKRGRGGSGNVSLFFGLAVAMLLYMTIFIYGLNVLRGVLEEKQSRVAEVVIASVSSTKLLLGKVIGVGAVGFTQLVLWMSMSFVMWKIRAPILEKLGAPQISSGFPDITVATGLILLAFFVLGFMFYAGLFAAVGATVNSEQEAQQAQMPVVLLLVCSVMFVQNVLLTPDSALSRTLSLLPFSAPIVMPLRMTVAPVPAMDIAFALLSVALGALFTTWLASRIYRVGLLMYGKKPSMREIMKWVRQG